MQQTFIHLHCHSEYSLVDGILRIKPWMQAVKSNNMQAIAITDQANLFAMVKFYKAAIAAGIKPIIGCDLWLENKQQEKRKLTSKPSARSLQRSKKSEFPLPGIEPGAHDSKSRVLPLHHRREKGRRENRTPSCRLNLFSRQSPAPTEITFPSSAPLLLAKAEQTPTQGIEP